MKDAVNIDCLRSQPRVSAVSSFLLSPSFASGLVFKSVSKEIRANELYSTWYVTCSFLSRNVKNSHRSVGSSTRLEQKLYNFLNVFTKHFICRCHRDNNPDKTSNANQVSATGRLSKEACFFLMILLATANQYVFVFRFERQRWTLSSCKDEQTKRKKSIDQSISFPCTVFSYHQTGGSMSDRHVFVLKIVFYQD